MANEKTTKFSAFFWQWKLKSITCNLPRSKFVTSVIQEDRKDLNSVQEICKGGAKYKQNNN